jgi:Ni/Fe-hydrogenase subunit HybB-like protein
MLISFGIIAVEILGYVLLIKYLPVLHEIDHDHERSNPSNPSTCPPSKSLGVA